MPRSPQGHPKEGPTGPSGLWGAKGRGPILMQDLSNFW